MSRSRVNLPPLFLTDPSAVARSDVYSRRKINISQSIPSRLVLSSSLPCQTSQPKSVGAIQQADGSVDWWGCVSLSIAIFISFETVRRKMRSEMQIAFQHFRLFTKKTRCRIGRRSVPGWTDAVAPWPRTAPPRSAAMAFKMLNPALEFFPIR